MSQEDLEINRAVRRILVRHWLDLGRLSIRSSLGRVTVRGALERIEGVNEQLTGALVESVFNEIRRIPAARTLHAEISNWTCQGTKWQPLSQGNGSESGTKISDA
jgi:hypothetical protein